MAKIATNPFLERIRTFRKKAGLSQQEVAKHLGLNQATYSAMERGSQKIFTEYLPKISKALGIQVWQLFADPQDLGILDDETVAFLEMWKKFDPSERNLLKAMAEQIIQKKELEMHDPEGNKDCGEDAASAEAMENKKGAVGA
jgi:transcriptional regulator with XRE-family HTH domain